MHQTPTQTLVPNTLNTSFSAVLSYSVLCHAKGWERAAFTYTRGHVQRQQVWILGQALCDGRGKNLISVLKIFNKVFTPWHADALNYRSTDKKNSTFWNGTKFYPEHVLNIDIQYRRILYAK